MIIAVYAVRSGRWAGPSFRRQRVSARAICHRIRFVVHAGQMKHAVQHQNADLGFDGMPAFASLRARPCQRDGDIAENVRRIICSPEGNDNTSVA